MRSSVPARCGDDLLGLGKRIEGAFVGEHRVGGENVVEKLIIARHGRWSWRSRRSTTLYQSGMETSSGRLGLVYVSIASTSSGDHGGQYPLTPPPVDATFHALTCLPRTASSPRPAAPERTAGHEGRSPWPSAFWELRLDAGPLALPDRC